MVAGAIRQSPTPDGVERSIEREERKMFVTRIRTLAMVGLMIAPGYASAQQINHNQLMGTLGRLEQGAPAVDVALLAEELAANAGKAS